MLNPDWFRRLHPAVVASDNVVERVWAELPVPEREAMVHVATIMRCSDEWPTLGLCREIARAFNAETRIVCAAFGYPRSRRVRGDEGLAWQICQQISARCH